ncbi:hypothetical protein [Actinoplanes aureus]|uniref:Uncharacterized protein n=1 Tax=Actinoplanes aureus TaxID=2792083 RepID=A0A931C407_9ACTN|nr:hypothetical protein [Actinoplanes aureus]MBG0560167.1 hypothetical protein [Actinoplanes aureus]
MAAVTGVALILGLSGCGGDSESSTESQAVSDGSSASPATSAVSPSGENAPTSPSPRPSKTPPSLSPSEKERVAKVRKSAVVGKVEIKRGMQPRPEASVDDLQITNSGNIKKDRSTMRVVSARGDLTGQRELAWVAGKGEPVGNGVSCTQRIRLQNNKKAGVRENLLLCWRLSAERSVYTVAVDLDGNPSRRKSVAAILKRWKTMN